MTQQPAPGAVPAWTLGDRLARALRHAGVSHAEMADFLRVGRNTVGNYVADRTQIPHSALVLWSMRTGVDQRWLEHGEAGGGTPPTPGGGLPKPPSEKLAALTAEKRRRSRRGAATEQYPLPSAA